MSSTYLSGSVEHSENVPTCNTSVVRSVASMKVPLLSKQLIEEGCEVKVVVTQRAQHFLEVEHSMPNGVQIHTDDDEWSSWKQRGDVVMHIELMKWADILVLAPISANTLAKISQGLCDNLGTCIARAWPLGTKPTLFCPAMNTRMWEHPITAEQIENSPLRSSDHNKWAWTSTENKQKTSHKQQPIENVQMLIH
ncbi:hypothetical protein B566_EDAN003520 [Ephemera danica]|nr:hypothetical protein B566_EDAN003520 [Ephemera danica]